MKEKVTALFHWQQRNQNSDQLRTVLSNIMIIGTLEHGDIDGT